MSTTEVQPAPKFQRPYEMLIDVDVHPTMREGIATLVPYMPRRWQEIFRAHGPIITPSGLSKPFPFTDNSPTKDAAPPDGSTPGSDPHFMVEDFFDRYDVGLGQMIMLEANATTSHCPDPEMQAVLIRAYNDWMLDEWIIDPRMRHALLVTTNNVDDAVAEIKRLGADPRVCSVCVIPAAGKGMGASYYHPVYEATLEMGLQIVTHSAGASFKIPGDSYVEDRVNVAIGAWFHTNSLVLQGTFERYPELKVMIIENGFSWVVPLMWRMDAGWRRNRLELPWLRKWPSEYVRDHIRLATQPVDDDPDATELYYQIEHPRMYLTDILCYSSDYPHWDNDRPGRVFNKISADAKRSIFCDNAKAMLRL
jgi:predicted TIM-barrel fold metal-dependent hydrolase